MSAELVIAVTGGALVVASGALGAVLRKLYTAEKWIVHQEQQIAESDRKLKDWLKTSIEDTKMVNNLLDKNIGLRAENRAFRAAEAKRQAQRVAASRIAAEIRRKNKGV